MNTRRDFIKQTSLLAAAAAIMPSFACTSPIIAKHAVGLQLYSLRDVIGNDITGIIEKVATIGYKEVETYGYSVKDGFWGLTPKDFANLLKQNGIKAPSGHYDFPNSMAGKGHEDLKACIAAANILGGEYVTIPWLDESVRKNADAYKKVAEHLNEAGELCKSSGLKIAYHNHDFEFKKLDQTTGLEIMLSGTDKNLVDFELDIYWAERSGVDPIDLFKKYPNRFTMWHIKDMDKQNHSANAEVGQGTIDFKAIFAEAKLSGVKHYFVEHETNYKPNELGSVKTSFDYVNNQLL